MTALQARLFAARALRAAQAQEELARRLRPDAKLPAQRTGEERPLPKLSVVPDDLIV
jgi:hypothetical protein